MAGPRSTGVRLLMRKIIRQRPRTGVFALILLIMALLFLVKLPFLVLSDREGKTSLVLPLSGEKNFSLYYIHSVHKTPVWDNFSVGQGDRLVLASTRFESLGVGIPFLPGEGNLVFENGKIVLSGLDRSFNELSLLLTPVAEQALLLRDKKYCFNDYFEPGDSIRIRVVRSSAGKVLWQRISNGGGN